MAIPARQEGGAGTVDERGHLRRLGNEGESA